MSGYVSRYSQYPFLNDPAADLRCDFEIATDRFASQAGLLCACVPERRAELLRVVELIYHANPTLRTRFSVTQAEIEWLAGATDALRLDTRERCRRFVLPVGSERACISHTLRCDGKALVRMAYRCAEAGIAVPDGLLDLLNLFSEYFFYLALWLNREDGVDEVEFVSRNY